MRALVVAIAVMMSGAAGAAERLPTFPIEEICGRGSPPKQVYNWCLDQEQQQYNEAKSAFDLVDDEIKAECREKADAENFRPYTMLNACYYVKRSARDYLRQVEREKNEPSKRFRY